MTAPQHTDIDLALELLQRVVTKRGDSFRYQDAYRDSDNRSEDDDEDGPNGCHYVIEGEPACLVGLAAHLHGITLAELQHYESESAGVIMTNFGFSAEGAAVFDAAQRVQDNGGTWGEALVAAKDRAAQEMTA